jgi:uncharacterized membrane protein (DUF2068 family)
MNGKPKPASGRNRAPTLYAIIGIKLLKGLALLLFGLGVYRLAGQHLDERFLEFIKWIKFDPETQFFAELEEKLKHITPTNVRGVAVGTMLYSIFSFVEGVGLISRVRWIGWVVIGESMFFIPIEAYDLMRGFSFVVFVILLINIWIVWYLLKNKERLFKHR